MLRIFKRPRGWLGWLSRIAALILLLVFVAFGLLAFKMGLFGDLRRLVVLPDCSAATNFQTVPVDLTKIKEIVPLGNVSPPDHTLPTDHMYIYFDQHASDSPLKAPGNIVVTNLEYSSEQINGTFPHPGDYSITFTNCRGYSTYFAHIKSLAGKLASDMKALMGSCSHDSPAVGEVTTYCKQATDITITGGEQIGVVGTHGDASAIDFGASQSGHIDPGAADRNFDGSDAVCPLDHFAGDAKAALYAKVSRSVTPRCGVIGQDKVGTIQGSWSSESNANDAKNNWNSHLAVAHYNKNPVFAEIATGGGALDRPGGVAFVPRTSGTVNREPSQTKVGIVYCYESDPAANVPVQALDGHLLLELTDDTHMKVERQNGGCDTFGTLTLSQPMMYYR